MGLVMPQTPQFKIAVDTREQKPFTFSCIDPPPATVAQALKTGDYSVVGFEDRITVERKSLTDLYGSCGQGRSRFEREIQRMAAFQVAAIICEADLYTIVKHPPCQTRLPPKSVLASMIAWTQRYRVQFWPCPTREFAERTTYRILYRFFCDVQEGVYDKPQLG